MFKLRFKPLDLHVYLEIYNYICNSTNYLVLTGHHLTSYLEFINTLNTKYGSQITRKQSLNIYQLVTKDIAINCKSPTVTVFWGLIKSEYDSDTSIRELAQKYSTAPSTLLTKLLEPTRKEIANDLSSDVDLTYAGYSKKQLDDITFVRQNDIFGARMTKLLTTTAETNENRVVQYFKTLGIPLITQNEIVEAQIKQHGRAIATPDILFHTPIMMNGREVNWVEYKDYMMLPKIFLGRKVQEQVNRYTDLWGPGALLFRYGFVNICVEEIKNCLLVDARTIGAGLE